MQSIVILHLHITPLDFKSNTQAFSFISRGVKKKYTFNCVGITDFFFTYTKSYQFQSLKIIRWLTSSLIRPALDDD